MSFFFLLSGDHRALRPFPTRRSSDLLGAARGVSEIAGHRARLRPDVGGELVEQLAPSRHQRQRILLARAELTRDRLVGDRKSTRLNSSHLGISYAVFCLKKKKNNKTQ